MNKTQLKGLIYDIPFDIIGSLLYAAGIYSFAANADFAPGGVSGMAIIVNHFTSLPIGLLTICLNIPIVLLSIRFLSKSFFLKSLKSMLFIAIFIDIVFPLLPSYHGNELLAAIFTGILTGAGLGFIYMRGSSTGGSDFLIFSAKKLWPQLSIGEITLVMDGIIILVGAFVFRKVDAALYGGIMTALETTVLDKIVSGSVMGKLTYIVTNFPQKVVDAIDLSTERGATVFECKGGYSKVEKNMVMCVCAKSEIVRLRRAVTAADPEAFIMVTDCAETFGLGFQPTNEQ